MIPSRHVDGRGGRILFLLALAFPSWGQVSAVPVSVNGDSAKRVDILFIGDGYTTADLGKFASDVASVVSSIFAQEPYREYQKYFNIWRLDITSAQSGVDHPESIPPVFRDTAFDAAYNCSGIQRLICVNNTKVNVAISVVPAIQRDLVVLLVNDPVYGGSGGQVAVASTNIASSEILLHETGHTLVSLADEYGGPPPPACADTVEPAQPNATKATQRALIKWNAWIDASTPIPTTSTATGTPGLYAGADYCDTTLFRPTYNSKMRSLGAPFEQINVEQHILKFYSYVSPIDSINPAAGNISLTAGQLQTFSVTTPVGFTHSLATTWSLDGTAAGSASTFVLDSSKLISGPHTLSLVVTDSTSMVRTDPNHLLTAQAAWTITVSSPASFVATIATVPTSLNVVVDGTAWTAPHVFSWVAGSSHTISAPSPQSAQTGTSYTLTGWSDGGAQSHSVTAASQDMTYTATFHAEAGVSPPSPSSVSPPSGNVPTQLMTFSFADPRGWQDLGILNILINSFLDGRRACYLAYSQPTNTLLLVDDAGDAGGPFIGQMTVDGSAHTIENSQCRIDGVGSSRSGNGNTLALTLNVTVKTAFAGSRIVYVAARDQTENNSGWQALGTWQVPGAAAGVITAVSASPSRGVGSAATNYTFTITDSKGAADIGIINVLVNDFIDGRHGCYLAYIAQSRLLVLVDDAGDAGGPFAGSLTLGDSGSISNGQCTVGLVSAPASGSTLSLTLNIAYKVPFIGNRIMFVAARDPVGGNNTDWQALGTWTVQ